MRNNKLLLIGGAVVIVLLVGGLVVLSNKSTPQNTTPAVEQQSVPTISADEIGLTLGPGKDKQNVIAKVSKIENIKSLDYQLSYVAKGGIPRGILGSIKVQKGYDEIYLGTCSDVCHPDSNVTNIKIIVKVTKTDGKVYQAETSL